MRKFFLLFALFLGILGTVSAQSTTKELFTAVLKNKPADVETLLANGANPNATVEMIPGFPTTCLIIAAGNNRLEIVKSLVEHKAQVNQTDNFKATALMAAAGKGNQDIVTFLLANGADVKAKDEDGKDALAAAKESGNAAVIALLEQKSK